MADAPANPQGQNPAPAQPQQAPLQVKVPEGVQSGVYSNAVSVNVNSNEVVVDFGYLLPNTGHPIIEVVSRVNMNARTAESFMNVLNGAMEDFKKKQAEATKKTDKPSAAANSGAPLPENA